MLIKLKLLFRFLPFLLILIPDGAQPIPILAPFFSASVSLTTNQDQANQNHSIIYYHNRRSVRSTVNSSDYGNFLSSLEAIDAIRKDKFFRLNSHYKHQDLKPTTLNGVPVVPQRPSLLPPGYTRKLLIVNGSSPPEASGLGPFQYRKFNFSTGIQFEEEFDCDLNLLSKCESSLLTKIELIEDRHEVFTTVHDRVASQEDILEICRSIDVEFKCLYDYAQKCEHQMSYSTFTILRYIITTNNETIVSCRHKEMDWLDINSHDRTDDPNKPSPSGPCISERHVYECFSDSFGHDFDPNLDVVETDSQCEAAHSYEKCIKHCLYEDSFANCQVEQKEKSLELLLSMIRFNVSDSVTGDSGSHNSSLYCKKLATYWSKKYSNKLNELERTGSDDGFGLMADLTDHVQVQDSASKLTNLLRFSYIALLPDHCTAKLDNVQELCLNRYEHRLRKLWHDLDMNYSKMNYLSSVDETEMMCCASSELTECISVFVLVRCGRQQFVTFHQQVEFSRLSSLPAQCSSYTYRTTTCQSLLKS